MTDPIDSGTPTDARLMLRVQGGELALMGVLFERHHQRMFNFFLRLTGNRQVAEDLVQECFLRMLRFRDTFRADGSYTAWMYQIGRNLSADHFRRHSRELLCEDERELDDVSPEPLPLEELESSERVALVRRALMELPPDKREVLVLSRFELLKYEEIARLLDCTVGAIKVRVHRAVKELATAYRRLADETPR